MRIKLPQWEKGWSDGYEMRKITKFALLPKRFRNPDLIIWLDSYYAIRTRYHNVRRGWVLDGDYEYSSKAKRDLAYENALRVL